MSSRTETGRPSRTGVHRREFRLPSSGTRPPLPRSDTDAAGCYTVRDLWAHTSATTTGSLRADVPSHAVTMLRIAPTC
ncbi:hypothetical protein [Nocardia sp. BMG51109]|uniref:hypothetical protein n=1 Tax=Nocardia sp. BMG51109 TaxID=1056816 RepID=UPI000465FCC0|nr:hypothetical protein [Nocardia sp. BMG51109]